ncbi:zinc finger, CCHC-type containing protein [Tanacetum coccineum]
MTTSVVTNSVFRGFLEKQKLTGPNFIDWYRQLRIVLSDIDKLDYLEQPIPPAPVPAQAGQQVAPKALAAHAAWQADQELLQTIQNYSMHGMGKTINELHAMRKLHEQTRPKQTAPALHGKYKRAFHPKPKISPPLKKKNHAKDSICHQCGETGHWKRKCPQNLAELLKNMNLSQGASSPGAYLGLILDATWCLCIMAATAFFAISSYSLDENVGSPLSRVILFGDIPTVIPSTSVVAPETSTIAPVISFAIF